MADPFTILAVASTALTAVGSYQQGRAQEEAAKYEAEQLRANAERTAAEGLRRAEEQRRQKQLQIANARAAQAASGGTTTDAGAVGQLGEISGVFERNALEEIYAANVQAEGQFRQAAAAEFSGRQARRAGTMTALTTILTGASSIYGNRPKPVKPPGATSYGAGPPTYRTTRTAIGGP